MTDVILETQHPSKAFKRFTALDGVSLHVEHGHIHALIEPNGADQTTCLKRRDITGRLKAKAYTNIMVEQNFRFAAPLADRFYVVEHGQVALAFDSSELDARMPELNQLLGV